MDRTPPPARRIGRRFQPRRHPRFALRSIGSPNWMINQDLCGGCRAVSAPVTGLDTTRGEDIDNTRCALGMGRNPSVADPVEWAR